MTFEHRGITITVQRDGLFCFQVGGESHRCRSLGEACKVIEQQTQIVPRLLICWADPYEPPLTTLLDDPEALYDPMRDDSYRNGYLLQEEELPEIVQIQREYRQFYERMQQHWERLMDGRKYAEEKDFRRKDAEGGVDA